MSTLEPGYYDLRVIVKTKSGETEAKMKLDCYVTSDRHMIAYKSQFKADLEKFGNTLAGSITFRRSLDQHASIHGWEGI